MQGIFIRGQRPLTKKAVKEAVAAGEVVELEATSVFGNEYGGPVTGMPEGKVAYCVGPDPYTSRKWYVNITRTGDKVTVK
jgi:hypothetical protein